MYLGTTGGGVWKSTNARASSAAAVSFAPLTDTLPVFAPTSGTTVFPSLSIGAISVQPGVPNGAILAGTGDPNNAEDSFYGGGILQSHDGGQTWTLTQGSIDGISGNHAFTGLSVAGLAWSGSQSGLVVAALSNSLKGDLVGAADPLNSVRGLYYSTDAGVTWHMSIVMDGGQTVQEPKISGQNAGGNAATAVVWNPVRKMFFAAIRYHGYYQSPDGIKWKRLLQQPGPSLSLFACPTNPGTIGNYLTCPIFRGALAVQPVTGDLFALTADSNDLDQGLWQDVCALSGSGCSQDTSFSKQLVSTPLEIGGSNTSIPQANYNLALSAVATGIGTANPDTLLFVGTVDLYRCSLNGGCTLRNTTNAINGCAAPAAVAGAQHAITTMATAGQPLLYLGNDGGLWRSTDGVNQQSSPCSSDDASHFDNLNGSLGSLAEVVGFAQDPGNPETLLAGLGANGTAGTSTANSGSSWAQLSAGQGSTVAIDPVNPQNWYVSTASGVSIRHCGSGSACAVASFTGAPTIGLPQVLNDVSLLTPPWLLDPALPSDIVVGTCRVWRGPAADGSLWSAANAISPLLSGSQKSACDGTNPVLRSLALAGPRSGATAAQDAGSTVLYAGMAGQFDGGGSAGGHLFSTLAGDTASSATAWTDLTSNPVSNGGGHFNPDGFDVSSLAADPHDTTGRTIYATIQGFNTARLYRSLNAGANWENLTSNLPPTPANSVLIDPNDANTVYIALDAGVYVTQSIGACTFENCWTLLGVGLPNAPVTQLAAASTMSTGDGRTGELRAGTYGRGIWQIPLLTAASAAQPVISLNAGVLIFSAQAVGTESAPQPITITNTGTAPLTISSASISGGAGTPITPLAQDFSQTNNCTVATILPTATCTLQVVFLPLASGVRPGTMTIFGNVAGGQATVSLLGTGTAAASIVLTPSRLDFGSTIIGTVAPAQNITISNVGTITATLAVPALTGADFSLSANTCGTTLAASTGCTVAISFTPTASGARSGTLTVSDSAGTQTALLAGSGALAATDGLSPGSLAFGPQKLGTVSPAQQVVVTNTGDVALTLIAVAASGDFTAVNDCGTSLNPHSTCSIAVAYAPKNVGAEAGTLIVSDEHGSRMLPLSGFGVAPDGVSLAPLFGLSFAPLGVGIVSEGQTVTLTNNTAVPLSIGTITTSAASFIVLPGSNTCGTTLAAESACVFQVAFDAQSSGPLTGLLTVSDSAAGSPQIVTLAGTGVDFTLSAGNNSATIASGQSAVYPLLLSSASGVPGTAVFTCSGAPAHATCLVVPGTVSLGTGTVLAIVTVATGVATAALPARHSFGWLALLLPLGLGASRLRRRGLPMQTLAAVVILCGMGAMVSCGAARVIPITSLPVGGGSAPSPPGTSTIVVSATSAGLVRTLNLTLIIQ